MSEASSKASDVPINWWIYGKKFGANRVQCTFCDHSMGGGVSRFKEHLAGKRGNCIPCTKVSDEIRTKANEALETMRASKTAKGVRIQELRDEVVIGEEEEEMETTSISQKDSSSVSTLWKNKQGSLDAHVRVQPLSEEAKGKGKVVSGGGKQSTLNEHWAKKAREDTCEYIARYVFETGIAFTNIIAPSFVQMAEAIGKFGPGLKTPTTYEISEKFLQSEVTSKRSQLENFMQSCKIYGCTLMTDMWTDKRGRSIMNLVLHAYAGTVFYDSENTSRAIHDGKFIFELVDATIEKIGEENVVQIVTDNASNNMSASKSLFAKRPSIFWTSCAAHTLNLLLQDIGRIKPIRSAIVMGRSVTRELYAHTLVHAMMKEKIEGELLRPGVTRFATAFLSLQSMKEKKSKLKSFVNSTEWEEMKFSRTPQGRKVYNIINNRMFWKNVTLALKVFEPIVKVLRRADSDSPSMGWLYGDLVVCKNEIELNLKHDEKKFKPISLLLEKRWNDKLKTHLHMAGHFLNPYFYYQRREIIEEDGAFMDGITECMCRMYANNPTYQDNIASEITLYQNQVGNFGRDVAQRQCKNPSVDLVAWWQMHGGSAPHLKKMAIRILRLTTSSSGCERNWSCFEMLHTKKRNKLSTEKLKDLVYVKFNAHVKEKFARRKKDPIVASMNHGKIDDWIDLSKSSGANNYDSDDDTDEEVFPGEQLTWRQVEELMGADPTPRASQRVKASKKTNASASSSKGKGKRKRVIEDEEDSESSSGSSSEDDSSSEEEGQEMEE